MKDRPQKADWLTKSNQSAHLIKTPVSGYLGKVTRQHLKSNLPKKPAHHVKERFGVRSILFA
jgi:hypothetical protein